MLEESGHGEDGPRTEPAAHVVARDMVEHGVIGNLEDIVLQLLEALDAHDFLFGGGVTEDEVTESHVFLEQASEVYAHLLRGLIDKTEVLSFRLLPVGRLRTLENQRHELVTAAYLPQQFQASLGVLLHPFRRITDAYLVVGHQPMNRKTGVADDS